MIDSGYLVSAVIALAGLSYCAWKQSRLINSLENQLKDTQFAFTTATNEWENEKVEIRAQARKDANKDSRRVIKGQVSEEILPLIPGFPWNISDVHLFGKPLDYVIYDGLADGELKEIILADVKTGKAVLTNSQKQIKQAIKEGRVRFATIRRSEEGSILIEYETNDEKFSSAESTNN